MLKRDLTETLIRFAKFPVVALLGPRQSGKTTLAKDTFANHVYINLENPTTRQLVKQDPPSFLKAHENQYGIIFDEFQYIPELLSYIQIEADEKKRPGYFVLTGSQNFLMNQSITQSLAGRVGILTLLPLGLNELRENNLLSDNAYEIIFKGGYPRIYDENVTPLETYPAYIQSYLERDVRQIINVENLDKFQTFMKLLAARTGQLLNISDLSSSAGIHRKTVESWLSILKASYIVFQLSPYWENYSKRVTKTPKIFFYDTGLACSLLGIESGKKLALDSMRGALFECFIIADFHKQYFNKGRRSHLYYWRNTSGTIEVGCIVKSGSFLTPIEIKSGETLMDQSFGSLTKWNELTNSNPSQGYIIYGGSHNQKIKAGNLINWQQAGDIISVMNED